MDKTENYTTSFSVEQSPEAVFAAVTNPKAWWSEDVEGQPDRLGGIFFYHYKDIHRGTFKVTELVPGKKVVWHVVQNYFNFIQDATEWTGTDIVFEIAGSGKGTELRFTHVGLKPSEECYEVCEDSWNFYLKASLKNLIANGAGQPKRAEQQRDGDGVEGNVEQQRSPALIPVVANVDGQSQRNRQPHGTNRQRRLVNQHAAEEEFFGHWIQ